MADTTDSKSVARKGVWVRLPPRAPTARAFDARHGARYNGDMRLSARNQLQGQVVGVNAGAVTTTVKVELAGGATVTSSITKEAAEELGLATGTRVTVIVKASDVILAVD
jgi:molybdopterin-binding protein